MSNRKRGIDWKDAAQLRAYHRQWYAENRERQRAKGRAHRAKHAAKAVEKNRKWREANPDYYRRRYAANREVVKMRMRARYWADPIAAVKAACDYAKRHPEVVNAINARHHARKRNAPGTGISSEQWREILVASCGLCTYCSQRRKLTLDHVEPLALGGAHDPENAVAACKRCNCSKRDKSLLLWLVSR